MHSEQQRTITIKFLMLLLFCCAYSLVSAQAVGAQLVSTDPVLYQKAVLLNDGDKAYEINENIQYLEDETNELTIQQVIQPTRQGDYKPGYEGPLNLGYSNSTFWVKVPIRYTGQRPTSEWWFQVDLPLLDESEFFMISERDGDSRVILNKSMSYETPLAERDVNHVTQIYRFSLTKNETAFIYLKFKSEFSIHLPISIYSPQGFVDKVTVEELLYGGFIGAILIMIAYNLFMFISVRESSFFYYVLYMLSYLIFLVTERVHGLSMFGEILPFFHKHNLSYYIWISWCFALLMARSFLETKKKEPDLDAAIKIALVIAVTSIFIAINIDQTTSIQWAVFGTMFYAVLMAWLGYSAMKSGNSAARFYVIAWILNFSGVAVYAFTVTGVLPFNFITGNSPHLGILCQLVLISFALGDRIKVAQRQAVLANRQSVLNLRRYRSLFNNAVEGIFQISLNRQFIDVNPAMAKMLGYSSPKNLIREVNNALSLCYPYEEDLNQVVNTIEKGGEIHDLDARYVGKNGVECWATSTVRVIYDKYHKPLHLEGTFVDITERVERESVEREREQERLERQLAEASAAAKSQFLANMSHEIRTPLTAIIGYGESLLDDTLTDDERHESSEVVVRSGKHLLQLINDILDHSKIDADKLETEIISVNILSLINEIKTYFSPRVEEKGLNFTVQYDFPLPEEVHTDPTRLKQILINLCANALKFTDRGGISMSVRCERQEEALYIKVIDTGIGVKQEQLDKLFDPFAQAAPSIARQYGGTGLGLSISRRLAEMLGGTIKASSVYGEGSEFEVVVSTGPLASTTFVRDRSELNLKRSRLAVTTAPRLKGRILYAEDNEINRKLIKQLVSRTGASLSLVVNGAEALEAGTRAGEHFDLILMDIQMPVMDGRDATIALREAGVNTPIVALTANVMAEDIAEYKEAGCNESMAKPVEKRTFYNMLSCYLEHDGEAESLDVPDQVAEPERKPLKGRVLLAEDNADNRLLMRRLISKIGLEIITAADGREAVSTAMRESVNLVLMDQHMPEMNGPEATQLLRQTGFNRPILAFTASDEQEDISAMLNAGCNGVLGKPVKMDELYKTLSEYFPVAEPQALDDQSDEPWSDTDILPIVEQFVSGMPNRVTQLKQSFESNDWTTLRGLAHQIKGTGGSLGFPNLTERAKSVEMAIKQENMEHINKLFDELIEETEVAVGSFRKKFPEPLGS